jgi:hypothetical protein
VAESADALVSGPATSLKNRNDRLTPHGVFSFSQQTPPHAHLLIQKDRQISLSVDLFFCSPNAYDTAFYPLIHFHTNPLFVSIFFT